MDEIRKARIILLAGFIGLFILILFAVYSIFPKGGNVKNSVAKLFKKEIAKSPGVIIPKQGVFRYKVPSKNPRFGEPLDFSKAIRRKFTNKEFPYASGVRSGILVDLDTREVLWEYDSSKAVPIASMIKMMTILLTMEALEDDLSISLDSPVKITNAATDVMRTGIVWLDKRETFPLRDLLRAVSIKSANDAAMQVAEFIAKGDITKFVARMNQRAKELNMTNSNFLNACGLPTKDRRSSVSTTHSMIILGERLLEYPDVMRWLGMRQSSIRTGANKTILSTTNKLLNYPGVDGMKTGFTNAAGFCLTFSVLRNNRRLMGSVTGFQSSIQRNKFCEKLIEWGYKSL